MSGIIHQSTSRKPSQMFLRAVCIAAPISALIVYAARDTGPRHEPAAPATASAQVAGAPPPTVVARTSPTAPTQPNAPVQGTLPPRTAPAGHERPAKEFSERNAAIDVRQLTSTQPQAARTFLTEVALAPGPKGGFIVSEVMTDSRYERLGVRTGDVIYSLDVPGAAAVDEGSMIALTSQAEIQLDVYRNGTMVHLRHSLATPAEADRAAGQ